MNISRGVTQPHVVAVDIARPAHQSLPWPIAASVICGVSLGLWLAVFRLFRLLSGL